jgi:hypothetical protein
MILWIVEDGKKETKAVLDAVQSAFPNTFTIYLNRDITWPPGARLPKLETAPGGSLTTVRAPFSSEHLPDIVVLDLLLEADESKPARDLSERPDFPGSLFYERLRSEEKDVRKRRSQVVIYSQFRGMKFTEDFVTDCKKIDNHLDGVDAKSPGLLVEKLQESIMKVQTEE